MRKSSSSHLSDLLENAQCSRVLLVNTGLNPQLEGLTWESPETKLAWPRGEREKPKHFLCLNTEEKMGRK